MTESPGPGAGNTGSAETTEIQLAYDRLQERAAFQTAFLGTASHELRAPINQIISLHQLILEDLCESPEEEREFLQQAHTAIYKVLHNLDLMITVSKLEMGRLQPVLAPVQLALVLREVEQLLTMKACNVNCRMQFQPIDPDLYGLTDTPWLTQALMVLIEGAISIPCSQIEVSATRLSPDQVAIHLTFDGSVTVWLADPSVGADKPIDQHSPVDLTPAFRYQLATRLLTPLQATLKQVGPDQDHIRFSVIMPSVQIR